MKSLNIKLLAITVLVIAIIGCDSSKPSVFTETAALINNAAFAQQLGEKQVQLYTLTGAKGIGAKITNYGGRVVALCVPDADRNPVDVVLGYNSLDEYLNNPENFLGAAIGRYGNRIGGSKFTLDGTDFQLSANEGENQLHGGLNGFHHVVWDAIQINDSKIEFTYLSADGEEGFPGNLLVKMTYELSIDNALKITYEASTDKTTICNLTHHSYFNLSGEGAETINDHILSINATGYTPVDSVLIPTGEIRDVEGTPFDFTLPTAIGARVNDKNTQMDHGHGYDHNWVISTENKELRVIASIYSPITKIQMDILTDQPGLQFYGGNFLDGTLTGKSGKPYNYRSALCLETQHFPDSPNKPNFPSVELEPGEIYSHVCEYKFSIHE